MEGPEPPSLNSTKDNGILNSVPSTQKLLIINLNTCFEKINNNFFDSLLTTPELLWNSRLRASAGRFIPGRQRRWWRSEPVIEVATYLREEQNAVELIEDTLAHEMIHYWLWLRRRPYGHTPEFHSKMRLMGVSRYNPVPRQRPYKYFYRCLSCAKEFPARRRLATLACGNCCNQLSGGRYDPRFRLRLERQM